MAAQSLSTWESVEAPGGATTALALASAGVDLMDVRLGSVDTLVWRAIAGAWFGGCVT
jgi:hypothetical protein